MKLSNNSIVGQKSVFGADVSPLSYWLDVWRYRGLLSFLVWRDLVVRYKQTAVGLVWVFIKAALNITVLSLLFGRVFRLETNGVPYSLIVLTGMLIWQFFTSIITDSSNCLAANSSLISKVFFPKIILPLNTLALCLVDFAIQFTLVIGLLYWYKVPLGWHVLATPLFVLLVSLLGLGFGMITASVSVKYRDIKHLIPFILQLGMYASPVAYLTYVVPEKWRLLYSINPLVGIIDGFRWSLLGNSVSPFWPGIAYSACFCIVVCLLGVWVFRNAEKDFVDVL